MAKEIIVTVGVDGGIHIEAEGFKGTACEKATEFLVKGLGVATGTTRKADYRQTETKRGAENRNKL